jgi:hypothetical protein
MKHTLAAIALATTMLLATQPGYAQSRQQDVCVKEGPDVGCKKIRHSQISRAHKTVKHRGKNIDPITTCAVSKASPCVPKRVSK